MIEQLDDAQSGQNDLDNIRSEIKNIEDKNWYGVVLIWIVIAFIVISVLIAYTEIALSLPFVLINALLVIIHLLLLKIGSSDKLKAYSGALILFVVTLILNWFLVDTFFLKNVFLVLVAIGGYSTFIYEEVKLKKLKEEMTRIKPNA